MSGPQQRSWHPAQRRAMVRAEGLQLATKTRQYGLLRPKVGQKEPPRLVKTQYELLRPRVGQKEPPRLRSTIYCSQTCGRKSNQDSAIELARKSHRDSAGRFVTAKRGPERATETRQYDLLRPDVGQKEPPRLGSTICCVSLSLPLSLLRAQAPKVVRRRSEG